MIIYRITIKHNIWQNSLAPDQNIPGTPLKKYQYRCLTNLVLQGIPHVYNPVKEAIFKSISSSIVLLKYTVIFFFEACIRIL